ADAPGRDRRRFSRLQLRLAARRLPGGPGDARRAGALHGLRRTPELAPLIGVSSRPAARAAKPRENGNVRPLHSTRLDGAAPGRQPFSRRGSYPGRRALFRMIAPLSFLTLLLLSFDPCAAQQGVRVSTPMPAVPPSAGAQVQVFQVLPGGSEVLYRKVPSSGS